MQTKKCHCFHFESIPFLIITCKLNELMCVLVFKTKQNKSNYSCNFIAWRELYICLISIPISNRMIYSFIDPITLHMCAPARKPMLDLKSIDCCWFCKTPHFFCQFKKNVCWASIVTKNACILGLKSSMQSAHVVNFAAFNIIDMIQSTKPKSLGIHIIQSINK